MGHSHIHPGPVRLASLMDAETRMPVASAGENGKLRDGYHRVAVALDLGLAELLVTGSWSESRSSLPRWSISGF